MYFMKNANEVCNDLGHTGTVFRRFKRMKTMEVLSKLANIGGNLAQSNQLKRNSYCSDEDSIRLLSAIVTKKERMP